MQHIGAYIKILATKLMPTL